jgi:putative FmdB family regulatory protein
MFYEFECDKCETRTERQFRMGEAPKVVKCDRCGGQANRVFSPFALSIDGAINRTSTFGESMRKRNDKAAHRMKGRTPGVRLKAHDYGNGDVRGV